MAREKIETGAWSDGRAKIIYLIPKEEFLAQEKEFEAVSSDYSELMANNAFKKGPPVVLSKIGGSILVHT